MTMLIISTFTGLWVGFMAGFEIADDKVIKSSEICEPIMVTGGH